MENALLQKYEKLLQELVLVRLRVINIIGIVLILSFSILDKIVYAQHWLTFLWIRIAIDAVFFLIFLLSFTPGARSHLFLLNDLMIFTVGAGISYMIYLSGGSSSDYYEGLNLTFLAICTVNSFRPKHNIFTSLAILGCYAAACFLSPAPFDIANFSSGIFFMGSTIIFMALISKFYGKQHFEQFLKSEEVASKNKELDSAYQKVRENERLKDEFFANVSHELRTPLTLIFAPLESLLSDPDQKWSGTTHSILETMHRNTSRLLQIINGLLDFSKLEAGKMEMKPVPLDLITATQTVVDDFRPAVQQKGLKLLFESGVTEAYVMMDHYFYDRILFNLISNAVKFTEKGEIKVQLDIRQSVLTLAIQDTGIGIPQDQVPHLFQKFRQVEGASTRRFEGTGLGLAMVKEFVQLLGGSITVSSQSGKGSRFTVTAPVPPAKKEDAVKITKAETKNFQPFIVPQDLPQKTSDRLRLGKILIAEDNQELAGYIGTLLEPLGEIQFAENGNKALEIALEWLPDVVLSDVMMPERDGITLCRDIKGSEMTRHIPVVLLTALTHREALLKGWEAGADEYLFKPFHPTELVTRIQSILNSVQLRQKIETQLTHQTEETTRLKTELEQLELFSFVASHDLQEPLHKLLMLSSILRHTQQGQWTTEQEQYLNTIDQSVHQMQQYFQDVLQYTRVGAPPDFQSVNLEIVFQHVRQQLAEDIKQTDAKIEKDSLPVIQADSHQMEQLFKNLLGNALKFHRPGTPSEIKITYKELPEVHLFRFADNGIGFEEKHGAEIFKPFFRLHKQKIKGSGIGLAICEKIVRRHGGSIQVISSKTGIGTVFEVRLSKNPLQPRKKLS